MASLVNSLSGCSDYQGLPVSTETAQKTFCALGEDWWKQVFDGKYHGYGKMVFDEGLHDDSQKEPGFYDSALRALHIAKDNIGAEFTVSLYCQLHKVACAHFQGKANNTEMLSSEAGSFRNRTDPDVICSFFAKSAVAFFDHTDLKDDNRISLIREFQLIRTYSGSETLKLCFESYLEGMHEYLHFNLLTPSHMLEFETLLQKKMGETAANLLKLKNDPQLRKACPSISLIDQLIYINYANPRDHECSFEEVIPHVICEFNRSIAAIDIELIQISLGDENKVNQLTNQKLILIADLYQKLEWFHAFRDGQGRTDLITLGMLLSKHGFCPAILDEPYVSTFAPLADWVSYLKEGMKKWQAAAKVSALFNQSV